MSRDKLGLFHARVGRIWGMAERDEKRGGSSVGCLIMGVVGAFIPVLYFLSIGPFVWLASRNESVHWIGVIYTPIGFLASKFEPIGNALEWYINLWTS